MEPSEKTRNFALKTSSGKFVKFCWIGIGIIMCMVGIIMLCIFGINNEIPTGVVVHNGVVVNEGTGYIKSFVIALPFFGLAFVITPLVIWFIDVITKFLRKGILPYEVSENKISKKDLIEKALRTEQFSVENNKDWLDFSLNWKNCFSADILNGSLLKSKAIYKKLIKLNDNYTYEELDYEAIGDIDMSRRGSFSFHKQIRLGHIQHHCIDYNLGKNNDTGNIGINKYTLNTLEFTNEIHKWLAENGYREASRL